jgi:N-acetylmuramoyl-L-alanine amidase
LLFSLTRGGPLFARVVVVQKDKVNIRQGASTASAIIGKADKGAIFAWEGASGDWAKIAVAGGKPGYIRNDLLLGYDDVLVAGSSVRIRDNPSLRGAVVGNANKGDKLAVSDFREGWYKIRYGKTSAWISADYSNLETSVALSSAPAAPEQNGQNKGGQSQWQPGDFDSVTVSTNVREGILSGRIITLDPGHGVWSDGLLDPGAQSPALGMWEKDVNLDVTLKLKAILEDLGATVWTTHSGTTNMTLYGRASVANQNASHIFVSIHANASDNTALNGHSVFFYAPVTDSRLSIQRPLRQALAKCIQDSMTRSVGRADLGVKENSFVVLRETNCPSVLVETAFLSNAEEELLLAQGAFRQQLAEAIAAGIVSYFK